MKSKMTRQFTAIESFPFMGKKRTHVMREGSTVFLIHGAPIRILKLDCTSCSEAESVLQNLLAKKPPKKVRTVNITAAMVGDEADKD